MTDAVKMAKARHALSEHEQMADAQAQCVPCKLCGGSAVITDAGIGAGYNIRCSGSTTWRPSNGCMVSDRRLGGWAYNVMEWWNRLNSTAALEQAGEPVAGENAEVIAVLAFAKARSWHHFGVAWDKLEKVSQDELVEQAAAFLIAPAPEAPIPTLQRLGQEFDAGEGNDAFRIMQEFYLSSSYDPKAERHADVVQAAIAFAISGSRRERPDCTCLPFAQEEGDCAAHPPQSRVAAEPVGLREAVEHLLHVGEFCRTDDTESALRKVRQALATPSQTDPQSREPSLTVADAWQDLVDKDDRTSPEEYPEMALITREELADYMRSAQSRGQAFDGEGEAAALRIGWWNDMRRRGVSQENAILAINAAISSAKRGEEG